MSSLCQRVMIRYRVAGTPERGGGGFLPARRSFLTVRSTWAERPLFLGSQKVKIPKVWTRGKNPPGKNAASSTLSEDRGKLLKRFASTVK